MELVLCSPKLGWTQFSFPISVFISCSVLFLLSFLLSPMAVWCQFCFPFSSLPEGSVVSVPAAPFNLPSPPPRSWHWSFSTHTGYKHSKLQIREKKKRTSAIWHLNSKVKHWKQKHKLVLHPKRDSQQRLQPNLQGKMCQIEGMDQLPGL